MIKQITVFMVGIMAGIMATAGYADEFPSKTVTIIVPFTAGGPTDTGARILARKLERDAGQAFIVENVGGAGSTIGITRVAIATADGYTLLFGTASGLVIAPHVYPDLKYDPIKSFDPIGQVAEQPFMILVNAKSPFKTFQELVRAAQAEPGKLNYGSSGIGTTIHLATELLMSGAKFNAVHIPFKGASQFMASLMGGEVDFVVDTPTAALPLIAAGKVRALAVMRPERLPALPNVPTLRESGFNDLDAATWFALLAPKGVSKPVLARLEKLLQAALADDQTRRALAAAGFDPAYLSSSDLAARIESDYKKYGQIVRTKNIRVGGH